MSKPEHPGAILQREVIQRLDITEYRLAKLLDVPSQRIRALITGKRSLTLDTALRLEQLLGTPASDWLTLQMQYDLFTVKETVSKGIQESVKPLRQATRKATHRHKHT
jgi:antitoxin HigA-1